MVRAGKLSPMCKTVLATVLVLAAGMLPAAQAPAPVTGVVFEDANGNGHRDVGERGLAGVSVSNQHEVVESGPDGAYRLASPGDGVVFVSVPNDHRAAGPFWKAVPGSGGATVDFALAARPARTTFTFIHASDTHVSKESLGRLQAFRSIAEARRADEMKIAHEEIFGPLLPISATAISTTPSTM